MRKSFRSEMDYLNSEFNRINHEGAVKWGGQWFGLNTIIVENCDHALIDSTEPKVKLALVKIATSILTECKLSPRKQKKEAKPCR